MKLYTKTGDSGITSLYDGNRIPKFSIFFKVLGDIDELSSNIGLLCAYLKEKKYPDKYLRKIQHKLLDIGSNIAVVKESRKKSVPKIQEEDVKLLEEWIDMCDEKNDKLTEFLLPGVNKTDSQCHICRSITRRVERGLWEIQYSDKIINGKSVINMENVDIDKNIIVYINRLSDFFFAFSRNLSNGEDIKVSDI